MHGSVCFEGKKERKDVVRNEMGMAAVHTAGVGVGVGAARWGVWRCRRSREGEHGWGGHWAGSLTVTAPRDCMHSKPPYALQPAPAPAPVHAPQQQGPGPHPRPRRPTTTQTHKEKGGIHLHGGVADEDDDGALSPPSRPRRRRKTARSSLLKRLRLSGEPALDGTSLMFSHSVLGR
ncbi:hypothetical protein U9M48_025972 [Paspalum notatum var. saurae]|uniref:Uncharacterized protein n=1 Tax=Paspalum notatum var. saurae TaxID=547442 RepID=A0AAQ3WXW9_PASNO